ncbi:cell division protein FtsA [Desulfitibacter alkalitolerans]|uniref:cell division protein FtsA n=1 Tax=Desulfitibacter alkalitolerans TaxID=264641 RepID=UPI000489C983|nr:cell division protein FtsA [Desulfitibacter alkalitolerans]
MPQNRIVVGLDVGSTKVAAMVGEITELGEVKITGIGECPSNGLRKGIIVDIDGVARSILQAVQSAERMSGQKIVSAYVGVTGAHIYSVNNKGVVAVGNKDGEISVADVERAVSAAKVINLPLDKEVLHVIPRQYVVDGYDGILDPVGMVGSRLEVEVSIIIGASASIQNLGKAVSRAGLHIEGFVLNPLASSEAVLQPVERDLASVVVDIGGGTTEISLFDEDGLWFASILPVGAYHVTSDLAVGLRIPLSQAERIKIEHGCVLSNLMPDEEYIVISNVGGQRKVSKKVLASIIEPRMQEILHMIKQEIKSSGFKGVIPAGVIFTGGGCCLDGLAELAAEHLDMPVRIGYPCNVGGMIDMVNNPRYATGIGLIIYGSRRMASQEAAADSDNNFKSYINSIKSWFKDLF